MVARSGEMGLCPHKAPCPQLVPLAQRQTRRDTSNCVCLVLAGFPRARAPGQPPPPGWPCPCHARPQRSFPACLKTS
eukprot:5557397-Alexandrium_andersonii.AAC.1